MLSEIGQASRTVQPTKRPKKATGLKGTVIAAGVVGVAVLLGLAFYLSQSGGNASQKETAAASNPVSPQDVAQSQACFDRAKVHWKQGQFDEAIADCNEALRLNPQSAETYIDRGVIYCDKGDLDHAIADSNEALRLDPKSSLAYANRGKFYAAKGDFDHAIADTKKALELDPHNAAAQDNLRKLNEGLAGSSHSQGPNAGEAPTPGGSPDMASFTQKISGEIDGLEISPSGDTILIAGRRATLWTIPALKEILPGSQECDYFSTPAAFSPDGNFLACLDGELVRIWNIRTTPASLVNSIPSYRGDNRSWTGLVWANDGTLISRNYEGGFQFSRLDKTKGAVAVASVGKGSYGTYFPPGELDKRIHLGLHGECTIGTNIAFSPTGKFFVTEMQTMKASGDYPGVCLWAIPTGSQSGVIDFALPSGEDVDRQTLGCKVSPDGKILAATLLYGNSNSSRHRKTSSPSLPDTRMILLHHFDSQPSQIILCAKDVHQGPPDIVDFRFVGFSPNGKVAATIAKTTIQTNSGTKEKQYVTLWDTVTGRKLQQIDDVGTGKVVFLQDCRTFVTGGGVSSANQPQHVDFWDVDTGQRKKQITDNGMSGFYLSADGRVLVTTYHILTSFTPMPDGQGSAIDRRFGGELGTPLRVFETGYNLAEQPTSPSSEQTATNAKGSAPPADSNPIASPLPKSENKEVAAKEAPSQTTVPVPPQEPSQKKSPVPDAGALAEATKLIKDIYGDDWKAAKTTAQKQALAKKLFQKAKETEPKDAARFVLLRLSRDIATQALDGQTAFQAIDEMDQSFQIDALEMKLAVLTTGASAEQTAEQHDTIAKVAADLSEKAVASENFPLAKQLNELALAEARKGRDARLTSRASHRSAEIDDLAKACEAIQAAATVLDKKPTDPDANLTLGKYKCFSKADWEKGLPMLALGSDEQLKTLAKSELQGAMSSAEQSKLGDGWWDLAETQEGTAKAQMQGRARYWYAKALPGATGLVKDKLEKRLDSTNGNMVEEHHDASNGNKVAKHREDSSGNKVQEITNPLRQKFAPNATKIGNHYYLVILKPCSWHKAGEACTQMGGYLAICETNEKQEALAKLKGEHVVWLGGSREQGGAFKWTNGKPIPKDRFKKIMNGHDYVAFEIGSRLNPRKPDGTSNKVAIKMIQGFICEWDN